jgi:hypothetical protein
MWFDFHYYYFGIYIKLAAVITQIIIDTAIGIAAFYFLSIYTEEILKTMHYFGSGLHVDVLKR